MSWLSDFTISQRYKVIIQAYHLITLIIFLKVLGHWYEVERSFYLPEIASGCTTFQFEPYNKAEQSKFANFKLAVAIKNINRM